MPVATGESRRGKASRGFLFDGLGHGVSTLLEREHQSLGILVAWNGDHDVDVESGITPGRNGQASRSAPRSRDPPPGGSLPLLTQAPPPRRIAMLGPGTLLNPRHDTSFDLLFGQLRRAPQSLTEELFGVIGKVECDAQILSVRDVRHRLQ